MKKRVLGLLAGSTAVLWGGAALAADACPSGTYEIIVSPDGKNYSVPGFDNWFLDTTGVANCLFTIPLDTGAPAGNIIVYSSDIRGYRFLDAGDEVDLSVDENGTEFNFSDDGPADDDIFLSDLVAATDGEVVVDGELALTSNSGGAFASVDSLDLTELGRITTPTDQTAAVVHLGATAGLLTGGLQPIEGGNEVGLIGGYGSYMLGATARYNISDGFSVLGGVSLVDQTAGASRTHGVLGAAGLRYVQPGLNNFRPMAEGGFVVGALGTAYPNTAAEVPTGLGTIYVKGGVVSDLAPATQLAFYGTLAETGLASDAFTQTFTGFTVDVPAQTGLFTTVKGTAALTTELAPTVDLTAEVSAGMVMSHSGMNATIPGIGSVSAKQDSGFVDYGVRLGWAPQPAVRLEVFAQGSLGQAIGAHNQVGASAKLTF